MHGRRAKKTICLFAGMLLGASGACSRTASDGNRGGGDASTGAVALALQLSPGVNVDRVDYQINGNGIVPLTGGIAVTDPGATASVLISGILAGTGYLVELSAIAGNGTTCAGSAPFDVQAGGTTAVTVVMRCRAISTTGGVVVGGTVNNCPALTSYSVGPLATSMGGTIAVAAAAADLDAADVLTIGWSATAGTFHSTASATTTYTCTVAGPQTLKVRVSDGKCEAVASVDVTCYFVECGNAVVDPGEQCDPPNGITCHVNCMRIPICGNGLLEGGEQCDPPNGTTCGSSCRDIDDGHQCGNGFIQPGETCDPPNGITCSFTCQTIPVCGNYLIEGSEQCDPPNGTFCDSSCRAIPDGTGCGNGRVDLGETCDPPIPGVCTATCQVVF